MSLIRLLSVAAALFLSLVAAPSHAAGEVQLLRAQASLNLGRTPTEGLTFDVLVKNLAYDKRVTVHIDDGSGSWTDVDGGYVRTIDSQTELWRVSLYYYAPSSTTATYTFAIKYATAGTTYWDNNGGANYALHVDSDGLLLRTPVMFETANADVVSNEVFGTVDVQNLAFTKSVNIIYTADNWATVQTVAAQYSAGPWGVDNSEKWTFVLKGVTHLPIQYAISYTAGGVTYWDNNYGQNYTLNAP